MIKQIDNYNKTHLFVRKVVSDHEISNEVAAIVSFETINQLDDKIRILEFIKESLLKDDKSLASTAVN